jgi:hypothetical protein
MSKSPSLTSRLWLFMLEHGGRWTVSELAEEVGETPERIDRVLWFMHTVGSVNKARSGQRKNGVAFGVTPRNRIPNGVTVAAVIGATQVRDQIERRAA